jgi:hypothetical protein
MTGTKREAEDTGKPETLNTWWNQIGEQKAQEDTEKEQRILYK